jgi:hypothetical protein
LKKTIAGKNDYVKDLQAEVDAAVSFHTQDQDEIERLKESVKELKATKAQLMRDHERLAVQRTRLRISSVEHTSARSSGATLIQELSPPLTNPSDELPPPELAPIMPVPTDSPRQNSIQETPKRHIRSESAPVRTNLMSNEVPPPELRGYKRRSLGLKDFVKKMVKKDGKAEVEPPKTASGKEEDAEELPPSRAPLSTKDKNTQIRPATAAPKVANQDPFYTAPTVPVPHNMRPANVRRHTPRYYAEQEAKNETRPQTAQTETRPQTATAEMKASKSDAATKSIHRLSWGAT